MTDVERNLLRHLSESNRIIFSAPFGIGKSYFLNDFFLGERAKDQYEPFFIYPINYCTAENKDIFEIIKYDLIYQLVKKELIEVNFEYKFDANIISRFSALLGNIADTVINTTSGTGVELNLIQKLKVFAKICTDFSENAYVPKKTEDNELLKFANNLYSKPGSFIESDNITSLIQKKITDIGKNTGKKPILIIEDLDRLDPAHIFRLLNIFSAHNDLKSDKNKFGFSKVIFVCDIENVEKIFRHFYGGEADFYGYISKFFDTKPYRFDNYAAMSHYIESWCNINLKSQRYNVHGELLCVTLRLLAINNGITFRQLLRLDGLKENIIKDYVFNSYCYSPAFEDNDDPEFLLSGFELNDATLLNPVWYSVPFVVLILNFLCANNNQLRKALTVLKENEVPISYSTALQGHIHAAKELYRNVHKVCQDYLSKHANIDKSNSEYCPEEGINFITINNPRDYDPLKVICEIAIRMGFAK